MLLPFEWPAHHARCLLREGKILADKHVVITAHEVLDPYILRVVAYDTEKGKEFVLYLNKRDVMLLLDAHDNEASQSGADAGASPAAFVHLYGAAAKRFQQVVSVEDKHLLDIVVASLSFSEFQSSQILVASEMRMPLQNKVLGVIEDGATSLPALPAPLPSGSNSATALPGSRALATID